MRVRGLPDGYTLSEGNQISPGNWAVPTGGLPNLTVKVPELAKGRFDLSILLVMVGGEVIAEAGTTLVIAAPEAEKPAAVASGSAPVSVTELTPAPLPLPAEPRPAVRPAAPPPSPPPAPPSVPVATIVPPQPVPAAPPPAAAPVPPQPAPPGETALRLTARGDRELADGSVAEARNFYERAAELGYALAAFKLGQTYDQEELAKLSVIGIAPDPAAARRWYETARRLGYAEAEVALARLPKP